MTNLEGSNRVRVLHIIQALNYGGMERLLADIVRGVDRDRVESHVLCLLYIGRFGDGLDDIAGMHLADPLPRYSMLWPGSLIRQIREIGPDIVHTHSGVWYKAAFAARRAGVKKVVHTEHGRHFPDPLQNRIADWLAAKHTSVVVAVSQLLGDQLLAKRIVRPDQLRIIANGVDTAAYRPNPNNGVIRRQLGIAPETPIIGSVGRLELIKGYDVMIEAFAVLRSRWPREPAPVLVVGGEGSQRQDLLRRVQAHGLSEEVFLLGWRDDIHDLHASFDFFTLSSRSEGTSVSLLEAMSAGLCPVVTRVGGNAAVLGPALSHRLVNPDAPADLAAAWAQALSDKARRSQDALAARERVKERFALDRMVQQYQELYLNNNDERMISSA